MTTKHKYYHFDFSEIVAPGMYVVKYNDFTTRPFKIGDDLYLLDDNDGYPYHHIFKYDGSAWNEDLDELPNARYADSNIKHAEHNGENYFLVGNSSFTARGGRFGVIKRSSNGDWMKIPIEHYGAYYISDYNIFSVNDTLMVFI